MEPFIKQLKQSFLEMLGSQGGMVLTEATFDQLVQRAKRELKTEK